MNIRLQMCLIIGVLFFALILLYFLSKKKLHIKYSLVWIFAVVMMLIAALFPNLISFFSHLIGISTPSNFIFMICGLFALLIIFVLTGIVSHMSLRIFRLVQTQALLEKRLRELESQIKLVQDKEEDQNESSLF